MPSAEMDFKIKKFVDLVSSKIGCGYVWASQGQILTQEVLSELIRIFGIQHYELSNGVKASKWLGKQVFDCSGLIVWALTELGLISQDYNSDGLLSICSKVSKDSLLPGDLVFVGNLSNNDTTHVGIYVGDGEVVHAMGTAYGVRITSFSEYSSWNIFGRLNCFNSGFFQTLKFGSKGDAVKKLQENLSILGYNIIIDGDFGPNTENVVTHFQSENDLKPDGIVGKLTFSKINELIDLMNSPVIIPETKVEEPVKVKSFKEIGFDYLVSEGYIISPEAHKPEDTLDIGTFGMMLKNKLEKK